MKPNRSQLLIVTFLLLFTELVMARAGGGGGIDGDAGTLTIILAFILAPFLMIYSGVVSVVLKRKQNQVNKLLKQLGTQDDLWNHRKMKARVEEIFFTVQNAWTERNQDLAKDCMTKRIYTKHKLQTDQMIRNGNRNVLEKINLIEATIFSVSDFRNDSNDTFSAHIKGSMIDYQINVETGAVISGRPGEVEHFSEIWHFNREDNKWMLDEIDQNVTISDLRRRDSY